MKRKAIIPLVLGLGIGIATVKLAVNTIRKAQAANQTAQTVTVVRAREDIDAHVEITAPMLEVIQTAESLFVPVEDRFDNIEEVKGRVTAKAIPKNAPVLRSMLAPEGTRPGMVGQIPPGFRAVSVKIDEVTGVSYQLQPGDWVDVIVVMDIDSAIKGGRKETIAEVILQHVQVAAIGYTTSAQSGVLPGGKTRPAKSATLLVPEIDVPKLHLAATRGKITLAMRGEDSTTTENPPVAYGDDVFADKRVPPTKHTSASTPRVTSQNFDPEPEPELPHAVLVYHGSVGGKGDPTIERITFEDARSSEIVDFKLGPPTYGSANMGPSRRHRRTSRPVRKGGTSLPGKSENKPQPVDGE